MALVRQIRDTLGCQFEGRNAQLLVAQNKQEGKNRRCAHRHLKTHTHKTRKTGDRESERERRETKDMQEEVHNLSISLFQYPKRLIYGTGSNKEQQQKEKT